MPISLRRPGTPIRPPAPGLRPWRLIAGLLLLLGGLLPLLSLAHPAATPAFAHSAFARTWARTDGPVAAHLAARGYFWGPAPGAVKQEAYAEGDGGARLVQYFDKSRMELNHPAADPTNPFYVTNGLLTVELVTGRLQVGDTRFVDRYPAQIPLASDTDDPTAPTYASFGPLLGGRDSRVGQVVADVVDRGGHTTSDSTLGADPGAQLAYYAPATRHNIPQVFWQFLNASGPI
ncbi:MAG TPA: hypothetical protein VKY74_04845, partial [Chloroflexia bacterium]|nr:hypothetical protein [Chloroflexia bacterium]